MSSELQTPPVVIELTGVAKRYARRARPGRRLWQALLGRHSLSTMTAEFTALHPSTLAIRQGEVVGIVGKNGAGKSTLLQIVSQTLSPSEGKLRVDGHVSAILELGAGFNIEFSGRENIHLAMATAGLTKAQTLERIEEIIDFSGIRDFIDNPLKTYSSGMYVRLAFSIATCSEPDILVIDEALSVGDGEFARKSFDRIMKLKQRGTTILFCSHSLFHIEALCSRALWIDGGKVVRDGHPHQVVPAYQDFLDGAAIDLPAPLAHGGGEALLADATVDSTSPATVSHGRLRKLSFTVDQPGAASITYTSGNTALMRSGQGAFRVLAQFDSDPGLPPPSFAVTLHSMDGRIIASAGAWNDKIILQRDDTGSGWVEVCFEALALLKGTYTLSVFLFCERGLHIYDNADHILHLEVVQEGIEQGLFHVPRSWLTSAQAPL
jgi:lipopolysaccharide transport system ATP-binding protein